MSQTPPTESSLRTDKELFFEALDLPAVSDRTAFLERVCAGDSDKRGRLEALLSNHFQQQVFMAESAVESSPPPAETQYEDLGTIIGRYKVLEKLGEGGFGTVYVAEQKAPVKRRVALKIIKLGMDTRQVVARFEAERQALAMMDHPSIAMVFDAAATETGRRYFVMELVRGTRITQYCEENHLPITERLKIFIQVCYAIQHAHQKGIIHRDIKPSNILITLHDGVPVPKVIDFGIAKAVEGDLTDKTLYTQYHQFIGTPAYMSPEQAEMSGLNVDTRTDIYGLGVLLYELLTGTTPFDGKELISSGIDEMRRTICEKDPVRPSTRLTRNPNSTLNADLSHFSLDRDLDWIVLKCLEKDRTHRYETAGDLARDVERFLNDEPISAAAPTALYRIRKFTRRKRKAGASSIAIITLLIAGIVTSTFLAMRASQAERVALNLRDQQVETNRKLQEQLAATDQERRRADLEKAAAEENHYVATMSLAQQAADREDHPRLRELLEQVAAYPGRGFEWYFWRTQEQRALVRLRGHLGSVQAGAWSPDGRRVVTGGSDATARVWDVAQQRELLALQGHSAGIVAVCWSADGKWIITGSDDHTAKVWFSETGALWQTFTLKGARVSALALSPDSAELFLGGNDGIIRIVNLESRIERLQIIGHSREIRSLALSPDGSRLASSSADETAKIWEIRTGKNVGVFSGHKGWVNSVAFSPTGEHLLTGAEDALAMIWDLAPERAILSLSGHESHINSAVFSPDGQRIVTASEDRTLKLCDAKTGHELGTLTIEQSTLSPSMMVWASLEFVAFSPDGRVVLTGSRDGNVLLWRPNYLTEPTSVLENVAAPTFSAFSRDSQGFVAGGPNGIAAIRELNGTTVVSLVGHTAALLSAVFSPDGGRALTASDDGTARIWDAATGRELARCLGHTNSVFAAIFTGDGQRVITSGPDNTIRLWDASTGRELKRIEAGGVFGALALTPEDRLIVGGGGPKLHLRDPQTLQVLKTLSGHSAQIFTMALSIDGKRILSGGFDNTARLWNADTGKEMLILRHANWVRRLAFAPDSQRFLTWGDKQPLVLWKATGEHLLALPAESLAALAFSPDGRTLAASRGDGTHFWTIASQEEVAQWDQLELAASNRVVQATAALAERTRLASEARSADPGAIKDWLLLGPIPMPERKPETEPLFRPEMVSTLHKTVRIGEKEVSWKSVNAPDTILNFNAIFGETQWSAVHALCFIDSEIPQNGIRILIGSDDYAEVQLNGERIYSSRLNRGFLEDEDAVKDVHLEAGRNVLIFTVVNETSEWKGSIRLTDRDGGPLRFVKLSSDPGTSANGGTTATLQPASATEQNRR